MAPLRRLDTKVIHVDADNPNQDALLPAAEAARDGQLVVFSTDTVYGVGTNALIPGAARAIFAAKERPAGKPLILLIADPEDASAYVSGIDERAERLMKAYWPGPLTLIFARAPGVPDEVTAGGDTVGVRCPDDLVARTLIRMTGVALATTSANIADKPSPKTAIEAKDQLEGRVSFIIDAGETTLGIESTVLDLSGEEPRMVREGAVSWEDIKKVLG